MTLLDWLYLALVVLSPIGAGVALGYVIHWCLELRRELRR